MKAKIQLYFRRKITYFSANFIYLAVSRPFKSRHSEVKPFSFALTETRELDIKNENYGAVYKQPVRRDE